MLLVLEKEFQGIGKIYTKDGEYICACRYFLNLYKRYINKELFSGLREFQGEVHPIEKSVLLGDMHTLVLDDGQKIDFFFTRISGGVQFTGGLYR